MTRLGAFLRRLAVGGALHMMAIFAACVAAGYFVLKPRRLAESLRFFRALFPERSLWARLLLSWRQYQGFARLYSERFLLSHHPEAITSTMEGMEHIDQVVSEGGGGVLVMSHVGNWEIAARILGQRRYPLLLYMGARKGTSLDAQEKNHLATDGVTVLAVPEGDDMFTAGIEGLTAARQGRLVSLAGDRSWSPSHARVEVTMLGHRVSLPLAPHALALVSGAPLITFFALRVGRRRYHFVAHRPRRVVAPHRSQRGEALRQSAQAYAQALEDILRQHPTQFYHFEPFLGKPAPEGGEASGDRTAEGTG